jgi:2-keto-4-pentenoate hydratase/2-oxohepta-3-ene-1,7-dioic acid hydratase in catechol pathway
MKIICIGRNYREHAEELNNPIPSQPVIFLKPETAILERDRPFQIPNWTEEVHYEIELVVRIQRSGKEITPDDAVHYYQEVSLGIDFTARDLQSKLKAKGHPWERAKAFDDSAVVGEFVKIEQLKMPVDDLRFQLTNHGAVVQDGHTADMIFPIDELIAEVSAFMTIAAGDLIFTGTPAGVAPVKPGDRLEGRLEGRTLFRVEVE